MSAPDRSVRAVEAALFAAETPMTVAAVSACVGPEADVAAALAQLRVEYAGRGINLVERGGRWHFQTAPDLAYLLRRERAEPRRLSRAGVETLAIIAYHEPVSRAEIEAIRGVQISKGTLDVLMEAGWIRPAGRREVPGSAGDRRSGRGRIARSGRFGDAHARDGKSIAGRLGWAQHQGE
jgi:segregation and condensation protein B